MELIDTLHQIIKESINAQQMTELAIGTVESVSPLSISLNANLPPIPEEALILTDSVKQRIVQALGTGEDTVTHNPVTTTTDVEVQSDLQVGDAVILLRVMRGQQFIVLSRIV